MMGIWLNMYSVITSCDNTVQAWQENKVQRNQKQQVQGTLSLKQQSGINQTL
jgi:hypothetical protein